MAGSMPWMRMASLMTQRHLLSGKTCRRLVGPGPLTHHVSSLPDWRPDNEIDVRSVSVRSIARRPVATTDAGRRLLAVIVSRVVFSSHANPIIDEILSSA
jgi:hypothetical protein